MTDISLESFEQTIQALLDADPRNSSKGKDMKDWFETNFSCTGTVSHIKEGKQIGNRVSEQFKHKASVVVFVCELEVNRDTLIKKVREQSYSGLNTVLIIGVDSPYRYEHLLTKKDSIFVQWATVNMNVQTEKLVSSNSHIKDDTHTSALITKKYQPYLTALQTKPFMLLAGISGTGKSRIVRELSFMTCPKYLQDIDGTTPGNYCMVEVKPNWHDSTELIGYWSNINEKYIFPKFIKFLVKAKMFPKIPFFVCLDEMNLAPVEQYFAEILSILETRKHPKNEDGNVDYTQIKTSCIVDSLYFTLFASNNKIKNVKDGTAFLKYKNDREIYMALHGIVTEDVIDPEVGNKTTLFTEGLTLPDNVFIIGTVNMDDTTHQFSRKVIDRAMTIEMNGGDLVDIFDSEDQLAYREEADVVGIGKVKSKYTTADEAVKNCETIAGNETFLSLVKGKDENGELVENSLPQRLESINKTLVGTPFTVSYRVMNELVILLAVLLDEAVANGEEIDDAKFSAYMDTAVGRILLMKILPRVEGDDEMFRVSAKERKQYNLKEQVNADGENVDYTKLDWLRDIAPQRPTVPENQNEDNQESESSKSYMAIDKLDEMIERLRRQNFTRYWP